MKNVDFRQAARWLLACCILLLTDVGAMAQSTREVRGTVLDAATDEPL